MTDVAVTEALGESLSPSQVNTYMTCPAKWYFRYLIGLSEPTTGALALGKAFHGTLARNFRQKLSASHDMEGEELREVFAAEWSTVITEADLRDDEDADEFAATGQILVAAYVISAPLRDFRTAWMSRLLNPAAFFPHICQRSRLQARQVCQRPSGRLRSQGKKASVFV